MQSLSMPDTKLYKRLITMVDKAKSERSKWEHIFDEIIQYVLPMRTYTSGRRSPRETAGEKQSARIYDSHQINAAEESAASIYGSLFNPAVKYLQVLFAEERLNDRADVKEILDEWTQEIMDTFSSPRFGFPTASMEAILQILTIGTTAFQTMKEGTGPRYTVLPTSSFYLLCDGDDTSSKVDTVIIIKKMTAKKLLETYGEDVLPPRIVQQAKHDAKGTTNEYEVAQVIKPFGEGDEAPMNDSHEVGSWTILTDHKTILKKGSFKQMPITVARASVVAGQLWGRSPAMRAMADILSLQQLVKADITARQLATNPPTKVGAGAIEGTLMTAPGAIIKCRRGRIGDVQPLFQGYNFNASEKIIEEKREAINRAFHLDVFKLPEFQRATTLEVQAVVQQKQQMLSPLINRLFSEFMIPVIDRTIDILLETGRIRKMPEDVQYERMKVEFIGQLAISQRMSEVANMNQWMAMISPLASIDPRAARKINTDFVISKSRSLMNVPVGAERTDEEVAAMVQAEQEQVAMNQAEQMAGAAKDGSVAIKNLSESQG